VPSVNQVSGTCDVFAVNIVESRSKESDDVHVVALLEEL